MALKRGGKKHWIKKKHPKHSAGELSSLKLKKNSKIMLMKPLKTIHFVKNLFIANLLVVGKKIKK